MLKKVSIVAILFGVCVGVSFDACAATTKTTKQSAIQKGTKVRTRIAPTGLYDQACYDTYYSCMDTFCITDNVSGGSCACSDDSLVLEKRYDAITAQLEEAERIRTEEVERVRAGADADIIFTGTRNYEEDGTLLAEGEVSKKEQRRRQLEELFSTSIYDEEDEDSIYDIDTTGLVGDALYTTAHELCTEQMPESCAGDLPFLRQTYQRQIKSDCVGFENSIVKSEGEAKIAIANAEADVRAALADSLAAANKYDRGTCMVEYRKCMQTTDACGKNWENCVSTIASENMQNNRAVSTAGSTVSTVVKYDFTESTMERLEAKRHICEGVLDSCVAVRDYVWDDFLREAAPMIKVAESRVESQFRQSCLTNISKCIQTACKDDIAGKGVATMDACLSRPDMARSFCKVEIDPCERMEPLIWGYVTDKLAAMRVDVCTQEVKDCFTADTRCGPNFQNCIGMDYEYIHDICPIDSLVVCKANKKGFSMDDLDSMLMGLYLNIDNAMIEQCQNRVDEKMAEICGSTSDCNRFASDDTIGTGSLRSQKDGTTYRVTGMISFGSIKMGNASGTVMDGDRVLAPGEIGIEDYLAHVRASNTNVDNAAGIISSIEEELNNIAGTINRTIDLISQDTEIAFCVNGRDLSQITGKANQQTSARFPKLLNQIKTQIAASALRQAQDNYNAKLNEQIAAAVKDASVDLAQYMCQKIAENGGGSSAHLAASTPLIAPYAISYDVGSGLSNEDLARGGAGVLNIEGVTFKNDGYLGNSSATLGGASKTVRAIFSRETRICHICTQTITQECKTTGSKSWFHNNRNTSCTPITSEEKCEDIQM